MEKYENFDYIKCHNEKIRDLILEALENTGLAVIVNNKIDGEFYLQVIKKISIKD